DRPDPAATDRRAKEPDPRRRRRGVRGAGLPPDDDPRHCQARRGRGRHHLQLLRQQAGPPLGRLRADEGVGPPGWRPLASDRGDRPAWLHPRHPAPRDDRFEGG
ncbi:MAG: hypothetical protein AVDCRST_MAG88-370, partial [uncultured Thermomicrobiales bacterium]